MDARKAGGCDPFQLAAASSCFTEAAFVASHTNPMLRRYIMPGFLATVVKGLPDVEAVKTEELGRKRMPFKDLPLISGRPLVLLGCIMTLVWRGPLATCSVYPKSWSARYR